jgi:DNA polymerase (family 10)
MAIRNSEIADLFDHLADLLEIEEANPFRVRAYRNASRIVRGSSKNMADLVNDGQDLSKLPSIGKDLAGKIETIVETGSLPLLEEVSARTPPALSDLMRIPGLGPKRVKILYKTLHVRSLDDLRKAADGGRIRELPGFGEKTECLIRERLGQRTGARMKLLEAEAIAEPLADYLRKAPGVKEVTVAGSYRRRKETVGDLDILVTARQASAAVDRFVAYDEVSEVLSKGNTRCSVRLRSGLQVDLRVVPQVSYGAALHYFTGSKAHNIAVRTIGVKKGYKINEYGLFKGSKRIAGRTEQEIYKKIGLTYIPPELREDRGEIQAAQRHRLPKLITREDIRGDLHCHTTETDGHNTLEQMAEAAVARGYEYVSINDHSKRVGIAHGLDEKRLMRQIKAIDKLNAKLDGFTILKSIELDILEDGSLDLPNRVLKELDLTVCSVHYQLKLPRQRQTERILRAMDNPYFTILGHPTGRLINEREPYDLDLEKIMRGAKERGCFLELDAQPSRLDLSDDACKLAAELGVKIAISSDAHSADGLALMRLGIDQARRGWLTADDVLNTRTLSKLRALLKRP